VGHPSGSEIRLADPFTIPYTGQKWHRLYIQSIDPITLPIVKVNPDLHIASFVLIDNYDLVKKLSGLMAKQIAKYNCEYLLCIEAKSLPLTYAICDQLNALYRRRKKIRVKYAVVRKTKKAYMKSPYSITIRSITTRKHQKLFIDRNDIAKLRKHAFVIVDDVISTGSTINALLRLLKTVHLSPRAIWTVLFEGEMSVTKVDYRHKSRIHSLGRIPLYVKEEA
jgi:adenine phosphoribosyltransferase